MPNYTLKIYKKKDVASLNLQTTVLYIQIAFTTTRVIFYKYPNRLNTETNFLDHKLLSEIMLKLFFSNKPILNIIYG